MWLCGPSRKRNALRILHEISLLQLRQEAVWTRGHLEKCQQCVRSVGCYLMSTIVSFVTIWITTTRSPGSRTSKSDCKPCHNRLWRIRHKLKKAHPAPVAGTPCACCGAVRRLHMDHCHRTDRFRGYVCSHCNTMIGLAGESRTGLENGIWYLSLIHI